MVCFLRNIVALILLTAVSGASAQCAANNCLRAVKADSFPSRPTKADCSSFLLATVTPRVSTITATATVSVTSSTTATIRTTSTLLSLETTTASTTTTESMTTTVTTVSYPEVPIPIRKAKRQVTIRPSAIPAYASPCSNSAAYSSACSCIGVTARTTTVATPRTTTTQTVTIVSSSISFTTLVSSTTATTLTTLTSSTTTTMFSTSTVAATATPTAFYLRQPGPFVPRYVYVQPEDNSNPTQRILTETDTVVRPGSLFRLDPATGVLTTNGTAGTSGGPVGTPATFVAYTDPADGPQWASYYVFFAERSVFLARAFPPLRCGVLADAASTTGLALRCHATYPAPDRVHWDTCPATTPQSGFILALIIGRQPNSCGGSFSVLEVVPAV